MANTRTVGATGADETSLSAALSWMQSNHNFDTDGIATIEIIDSAAYDESLTISGIAGTPSSTAYLKITVSSGNRHSGASGTGHARISYSGANTAAIQVETDYTVVEHLEIYRSNPGTSDEGIRITSGVNDVLISRCIIWADSGVADTDGIYTGNWPASYSVDNCIIYGWNRGGIHLQNYNGTSSQTVNIDHCTLYDCGELDTDEGSIVSRATDSGSSNTLNIYNTASMNAGVAGRDFFDNTGSGSTTWTGTNNACSDTSLTSVGLTTGAQESLTTSDTTQSSGSYFVVNSLTAGSEDLTLLDDAAGNLAYGNGTDRSGSEPDARQDFSTDIAGNARSTTSPSPDIGASEYTAAPSGVTGTISETLGDTASSASGTVTNSGSLSETLENASVTASGVVGGAVSGTISQTLEDAISAANGFLTVSGLISETLESATSAANGDLTVSGSASDTLENVSGAAVGVLSVIGAISETLESTVSTSAGSVYISGSLSETLENATGSASGVVGNVVAGSISVTLDDTGITASGVVPYTGAISETLENASMTASGSVTLNVTGTISETLYSVTISAAGNVVVDYQTPAHNMTTVTENRIMSALTENREMTAL
jgi:hypothetical protein